MFSRPSDLITRYPRQYCIHDPEYLCVYFPVHFNNLRRKKETKEIKTIELNSVILQKIDQHNLWVCFEHFFRRLLVFFLVEYQNLLYAVLLLLQQKLLINQTQTENLQDCVKGCCDVLHVQEVTCVGTITVQR